MASKYQILKQIETIQNKVQALWHKIGKDYGNHCQTIGRELTALEKKIESGEVNLK